MLNFAIKENIPFTNNLAERDVRPWKTKLKVSGCFRTLDGAKRYVWIKGFCSFARKHGLSVYEQLIAAMDGRSFLVDGVATKQLRTDTKKGGVPAGTPPNRNRELTLPRKEVAGLTYLPVLISR